MRVVRCSLELRCVGARNSPTKKLRRWYFHKKHTKHLNQSSIIESCVKHLKLPNFGTFNGDTKCITITLTHKFYVRHLIPGTRALPQECQPTKSFIKLAILLHFQVCIFLLETSNYPSIFQFNVYN